MTRIQLSGGADEITASFRRFGPLIVDWPHKAESKSYFPPKGYAFLLFQDESSVQALIDACIEEDGKLYLCVSSPTIKDKPVQIRPWNLSDSDFVMDGSQPLDPRKTIFVGGVPRPLRAVELAMIMDRLYGGVCYAGIDTDPELKYPKGAGRVAFSNQQSYIAAISARFVQLQHGEIDKRVEVKPYVLDDQLCDESQTHGALSATSFLLGAAFAKRAATFHTSGETLGGDGLREAKADTFDFPFPSRNVGKVIKRKKQKSKAWLKVWKVISKMLEENEKFRSRLLTCSQLHGEGNDMNQRSQSEVSCLDRESLFGWV
ncbi:cytoplasmic polyadenylation element-binding protein 4 isoform C [Patagioenas fasciata monilis]|uniref:Cytoplasmic polyadenylation element-binding protein 4 isoform C n=1 Tax=Patagioenas fasciata monilis TaxID=372326 RepID=A0A1V4KU90_PATFA|nr:cytoplasmic polyadenylation element-binding protein 4 isoform C [Patagioenas fasciata monilis]